LPFRRRACLNGSTCRTCLCTESRYTHVTSTPTFKSQNELKLYTSNLMIDKYIPMKRDVEREMGKHDYGSPYL